MSTVIFLDPSPNTGGGQAANAPGSPFITYSNGQMVLNIPPGSKVVTNVGGNASSTLDDGSGNLTVGGTVTAGGVLTSQVVRSSSVAASAALVNVETVLQTLTLSPGSTLKVGSKIRIVIDGTSTASVAGTSAFTIRAGTAGTTADASVVAFTTGVSGTGTGIAFRAAIELTVQTLGASGTAFGSAQVVSTGLTGIIATTPVVLAGTSSTLATTTATKLSVTYVAGAATNGITAQDVSIEVIP